MGGGGSLSLKRRNVREVSGKAGWRKPPPGFKYKDLTLTPFMVASALRADGFWLRQTVIWSKPAAIEPARSDRPATSHEYLFLLHTSERNALTVNTEKKWWFSTVWEIPVSPGIDGHPAPMPVELVRRCVVASTSPGMVVVDPFSGAGTTGLVADRLGRDAVLIELNAEYADLARRRIAGDAPLFVEVT